MTKIKLVYILSLRNAAADRAGQDIEYKGGLRYMKSPLEFLVEQLNETELGESYSLEGVIYDDDEGSATDRAKLGEYGFACQPGKPWIHPPHLAVEGRPVTSLLHAIPSTYRRLPLDSSERPAQKSAFERRLLAKLVELDADFVVLDGLLVILDELVRPGAPFHRRIANIHPGVTRLGSRYERRGAYATLDALHGARGRKVVDWTTGETRPVPPVDRTGASFHYVDNGIDSGEVIFDVLATPIDVNDTILELRWNNFQQSLFPALEGGLATMAESFVKASI
ncbi:MULTISPECIES: N(5)-hydroxyornithine transformylase PvdF [unclassified Caballeronia]|uniref:N(5)-hydroxyornithine transformylase PvdF n=1 Tax=unclassified Caballeronia TaxID=2646786 RepID=UPI00286413AD|nr:MULTISPECIES: N(5)-hydroxyornithine transformylase PvdF [unclassified Caballeronia]MDR5753414.1 N(5)-hydroxyornithine transformylase PvdF [Caballeronia sp. LZ024]MDR5841152.1 N(5)-hydroxyornithine transformylase PvdF [Caballeronia sp. LZ031]